MLEKPNLADEQLVVSIYRHYGLSITDIRFLPLGQDSNAWVYRVQTVEGDAYFLKLRRGTLYKPAFLIPGYLKDHGIPQVVSPLPTTNGEYWGEVSDFHLILYPFIEGDSGLRRGMSEDQWAAFGAFLKELHSLRLPSELVEQIPRETFVSTWLPRLRALHEEILVTEYTNPYQKELTSFWEAKSAQITAICDRVEALEQVRQNEPNGFVLCHADIHTGNVLLDTQGGLHIVDWDQPLLAPKERDLMFIGGGIAELATPAQVEAFYRGYGPVEIDWATMAYYRYEWAVQDMGDFSARVFLWEEMGAETKREAIDFFRSLFEPGRIIDTAYRAEVRGR